MWAPWAGRLLLSIGGWQVWRSLVDLVRPGSSDNTTPGGAAFQAMLRKVELVAGLVGAYLLWQHLKPGARR